MAEIALVGQDSMALWALLSGSEPASVARTWQRPSSETSKTSEASVSQEPLPMHLSRSTLIFTGAHL